LREPAINDQDAKSLGLDQDRGVSLSLRLVLGEMEEGAVSILAFAPPRRYSGQSTSPLNHAPEKKPGRLNAAPRLFACSNG
jgi:hypothetical protein